MIVSRATGAMDRSAVARSAIESAAENLSDGVIAPAFWFLAGGLPGLMTKFQQAGLGNVIASWLSAGPNQAISGEQLSQVLGSGPLSQVAAQLGVAPGAAAGQLAQVLPGLVDHLSPQGQAPHGGFGDANDLLGMLGGLLQK